MVAVARTLTLALLAAAPQTRPPSKSQAPPPFAWGADVNRGAGAKLCDSVHRELLAIVRAPAKGRASLASSLMTKRAVEAIEAWKRFRNPELVELARACLDHPDWHVVHRALHWSGRLRDPTLLERALRKLDDPEPRLREMAVLACLQAVDPQTSEQELAVVREKLAERIGAEKDFHVRQALLALQRRVAGRLEPREIQPELRVTLADGLIWTPLLPRLSHLEEVAPGAQLREACELGAASARTLPVVERWTAPLLGYGQEEVPRIVLQPFGKERQDGALVHTGQDVGGCGDGAGFYALADGVVRMVSTGTDMGTGVVVEHRMAEDQLVNVVYMHGAGTVYVKVGEQVAGGQLLGTMGLSWSAENGGQFAHLHLGVYPGAFQSGHNYGYKPAAGGLEDWLDPAEWLPPRLR